MGNTNEGKGSQENDAEQSGKNSIQKGAGQALEMCGNAGKMDERNESNIEPLQTPDAIPMKTIYPEPLSDIISMNKKMKRVRVVLTSKDTVRGITREETDAEQKEVLKENKHDVEEAREVVWAECNKELSNLVNQISEQIDTEVEEEREDDTCAKEESDNTSESLKLAKLDEPKQIEFNPEWVKDAVRRGQTCYVHIKNECFSTLY